jgi:SAM-dependent methyltransferase
MYNEVIVDLKAKNKYDFLDLGCKKGNSMYWCHEAYGGKGLGIDLNPEWVEYTKKRGYDAMQADALELEFKKNSFRYVSMMDFLEHMPSEKEVKKVLTNCKQWASDFFFIHHPSFEDINYLKKLGLKIDWTDGYNHTCPLTIEDFKRIFKELGINDFKIQQKKLIADTSDPHIIPLNAPHDTHLYNKKLGPKKKFKFDKPVYGRVEIIVPTNWRTTLKLKMNPKHYNYSNNIAVPACT